MVWPLIICDIEVEAESEAEVAEAEVIVNDHFHFLGIVQVFFPKVFEYTPNNQYKH